MTLNEVKELIELVAQKGFAEFEVEHSGFKLKIVATTHVGPRPSHASVTTSFAEQPAPATPLVAAGIVAEPQVEAPSHAPQPESASTDGLYIVKSPIVGTFYRAPSPTSDVFVKVGDHVDAGTVLCIIEAMKLMNEIEAEQAGEIVKIFVENAQPVEYGQPLFGIRP